MKTKPPVRKAMITERALIQRINRKLQQQPNPEVLRAARTERQREELGDYFTVCESTFGEPKKAISSGVCRVFVRIERLASELGVIRPWEEVTS